MRIYQIYIATIVLGVATACSESSIDDTIINGAVDVVQPSDQPSDDGDGAVRFFAAVDDYESISSISSSRSICSNYSTRSGKEAWSIGDTVDIALELTSLITEETTPDIKSYSITDATNGTLEPTTAADGLHYQEGDDNSYFAIYPSGKIEAGSNIYKVDLTDQQAGVAALDLLYASSVVLSQGTSDNQLSLSFRHQYALVKFTIADSASGFTIDSNSVIELKGAYSTADFNIVSGTFENKAIANIKLPASNSFELLVLPWQNMSDIELIIYSNNVVKIYKPNIVEQDDSMVIWKAGQQYEYNISF